MKKTEGRNSFDVQKFQNKYFLGEFHLINKGNTRQKNIYRITSGPVLLRKIPKYTIRKLCWFSILKWMGLCGSHAHLFIIKRAFHFGIYFSPTDRFLFSKLTLPIDSQNCVLPIFYLLVYCAFFFLFDACLRSNSNDVKVKKDPNWTGAFKTPTQTYVRCTQYKYHNC